MILPSKSRNKKVLVASQIALACSVQASDKVDGLQRAGVCLRACE